MSFVLAQPTEWWLEVPSTMQTHCWQASQTLAGPAHRQQFYLNQLCLQVFVPWFQQEYAPEASVWPDMDSLQSIWELVGGSGVAIGAKHLALLPVDTLDIDGLVVPQEWVDIPAWVADYYLAIQIDLENQWLRVWGYTTHQNLKQNAYYDEADRTYCLQSQQLQCDLNAFWQILQHCPEANTQALLPSLPHLTKTQLQQAMQHLSQADVIFPRLALPFEQWGVLLHCRDWCQQLYRRRLNAFNQVENPTATKLGSWFQNFFGNEWQSLESLLANYPAFAHNLRRARQAKGFCAPRVKFITLNAESDPQTIALLMVLNSGVEDGRMGVRVQVHPAIDGQYVPTDLVLSIYSNDDEILQSVQAYGQEDYMRLPYFRCVPGAQFRLQVTLGDDIFSETFSV